mmetsp:Transcript_1427/g.4036  ORF Transcript_1427/g.4036 Transcript_1427/m.4036 type:complete len:168 (+) Transcript_1427:124-627(+)
MGGCGSKKSIEVAEPKSKPIISEQNKKVQQALESDARLVEVVVPRGARGGDVIVVGSDTATASGLPRRLNVRVPNGLKAGQNFLVRIPDEAELRSQPQVAKPALGQQQVIIVHESRGRYGRYGRHGRYGPYYDPYYDPYYYNPYYYDPVVPMAAGMAGGLMLGAVLF